MTPAQQFLSLFVNNQNNYALQQSNGSYVAIKNKQIDDQTFERHILGDVTLGTYSISPDNTCNYVCWDLDYENEQAVCTLIGWLSFNGISCYRESIRPGRSGHIWAFFDEPIPSRQAHTLGMYAKFYAGFSAESFPKQSGLKPGGFGNLVRLPLGLHRKMFPGKVRGLFADCPSKDAIDQLFWICEQRMNSSELVLEFIDNLPLIKEPTKRKTSLRLNNGDLLELFPTDWPMKDMPNGEIVARCPRCAHEGHDTQCNNLSINPTENILYCHYGHDFMNILTSLRNLKKITV